MVVITAYATFDTAVEAIKRGARATTCPSPSRPPQIRHVVEQVARQRRAIAARLDDLEERLAEAAPEVELDTGLARMRAALETLARAAPATSPVLLRGESGTGKGVLARALHAAAARAGRARSWP